MEKRVSTIADALEGANIIVHGTDGRISRWSRGCEELYGWSSAEVEGKIVHDLLATTFPQPIEEICARLSAHGTWVGQLEQKHKDGNTVFVASRWTYLASEEGARCHRPDRQRHHESQAHPG